MIAPGYTIPVLGSVEIGLKRSNFYNAKPKIILADLALVLNPQTDWLQRSFSKHAEPPNQLFHCLKLMSKENGRPHEIVWDSTSLAQCVLGTKIDF